jgi:hypothetical protein
MFINVYVDEETFSNILFNRNPFNACLIPDGHATICISVPIDSVYETEPGMVTVSRDEKS